MGPSGPADVFDVDFYTLAYRVSSYFMFLLCDYAPRHWMVDLLPYVRALPADVMLRWSCGEEFGGVYAFVSYTTGYTYVGKSYSLSPRLRSHVERVRSGGPKVARFYRWMRHYGLHNYGMIPVWVSHDRKAIDVAERLLIRCAQSGKTLNVRGVKRHSGRVRSAAVVAKQRRRRTLLGRSAHRRHVHFPAVRARKAAEVELSRDGRVGDLAGYFAECEGTASLRGLYSQVIRIGPGDWHTTDLPKMKLAFGHSQVSIQEPDGRLELGTLAEVAARMRAGKHAHTATNPPSSV